MATQCNQTVLTVDNFCAGRSSGTFDIEDLETQGANLYSPYVEGYIYYTGEVTVVLCCIPDWNSITWDTNLTGDIEINTTSTPPPYEEDTEITVSISIATGRPFQLTDAGPVYFNVLISCGGTVYEYPVNLVDSVGCDSKQRSRITDPAGNVTTFDLLSPSSTNILVAYTMYQNDDSITVFDGITTADPVITTELARDEGYLVFDCQRYVTIHSGFSNLGYKLFCSRSGIPCGSSLTLQDEELAFGTLVGYNILSYFDAFIFDSVPGQPFRLDYVANLVDTTVVSGLFTGVGYKISLLSVSPINRNIYATHSGALPGLDSCPVVPDYNSSYDISIDAFSGVCIGRTGLDTGYLEITATSDKVILFISGNRLCNRDAATNVNITVAPDVIGSSIVFTSDCNASCPP